MVFTIRGHLSWKYPGTGCATCRHDQPDNDASLMFSRQDKQIGSDLTKEATEAHIAIVLSIS